MTTADAITEALVRFNTLCETSVLEVDGAGLSPVQWTIQGAIVMLALAEAHPEVVPLLLRGLDAFNDLLAGEGITDNPLAAGRILVRELFDPAID